MKSDFDSVYGEITGQTDLVAVEQQQHVLQRPPLAGQVFPQSVGGGGQVKVRGVGHLVDGAVREEAGGSRFLQEGTL